MRGSCFIPLISFLLSLTGLVIISNCDIVTVPLAEGEPTKEECPTSLWGANCTFNCSVNCENKTCDSITGFCFCAIGVPEVGCEPIPKSYNDLIVKFWLMVCFSSLLGAILLLVCGVKFHRRSKARKKKVLNVVFTRGSEHRVDSNHSKDFSRGNGSSDGIGQKEYVSSAASTLSSSTRITPSSRGSQRNVDGKYYGSELHGIPKRHKGRIGSIAKSLNEKRAIEKRHESEKLAMELAQAMPDFKINFNKTGEMTIVRKPQGKVLDKEAIKKIILNRAQKAQETVRKKSYSRSRGNTSGTIEKPSMDLTAHY